MVIWASLVTQLVKNRLQCRRPLLDSWVGKIPWRRDRLPTPIFLGFPYGSANKESACNAGYLGSISGLGRFPGEGKGYPLQYSGLENSMDYTVHGGHKESDTTEKLSLSGGKKDKKGKKEEKKTNEFTSGNNACKTTMD